MKFFSPTFCDFSPTPLQLFSKPPINFLETRNPKPLTLDPNLKTLNLRPSSGPRFGVCNFDLKNLKSCSLLEKKKINHPILRAAVILLCALPSRFHPPSSFTSLLLDFPCATRATPIAPDRLFLNVQSVGSIDRPPYCRPVPSPASLIRLDLLRSLLLDSPCATRATPIAPDSFFFNVRCIFLQLVEESLNENKFKKFRVVRIVSRPFGVATNGPHAKCVYAIPSCILLRRLCG